MACFECMIHVTAGSKTCQLSQFWGSLAPPAPPGYACGTGLPPLCRTLSPASEMPSYGHITKTRRRQRSKLFVVAVTQCSVNYNQSRVHPAEACRWIDQIRTDRGNHDFPPESKQNPV